MPIPKALYLMDHLSSTFCFFTLSELYEKLVYLPDSLVRKYCHRLATKKRDYVQTAEVMS